MSLQKPTIIQELVRFACQLWVDVPAKNTDFDEETCQFCMAMLLIRDADFACRVYISIRPTETGWNDWQEGGGDSIGFTRTHLISLELARTHLSSAELARNHLSSTELTRTH